MTLPPEERFDAAVHRLNEHARTAVLAYELRKGQQSHRENISALALEILADAMREVFKLSVGAERYEWPDGWPMVIIGERRSTMEQERLALTRSFADVLRLPADRIREVVLEQIQSFVEQTLRRAFEPWYHEILTIQIRQNVRAFSNDRLAELAGYVNAEVGRRSAAPPTA